MCKLYKVYFMYYTVCTNHESMCILYKVYLMYYTVWTNCESMCKLYKVYHMHYKVCTNNEYAQIVQGVTVKCMCLWQVNINCTSYNCIYIGVSRKWVTFWTCISSEAMKAPIQYTVGGVISNQSNMFQLNLYNFVQVRF